MAQIITGSFEDQEKEKKLTLPNILTTARAIGGVALGALVATKNIEPSIAFGSATALALSDAEGTLINVAKKTPRLADLLLIKATKHGRILDPVADKIFAASVLTGGMVGGVVPYAAGGLVVATELATVGATAYTTKVNGKEPSVSKVGKLSMISRFAMISSYFAAAASNNEFVQRGLENTGHLSAICAVALGALSCANIFKQSRQPDFTEA